MSTPTPPGADPTARRGFLPPIGSVAYYILLGAVAILILGPLGGVTASYMNFALGTFVGGQVLAGILGSVVTYGYGAEGKHGANYMQTMAASVAGMAGMAVLIQARVWLGLPDLPAWQMMLYFGSIGMFGVGVGMLYTPILVDKMQLPYPSGLAVANILRALTDKRLLKQSIAKLGGGTAIGIIGGLASLKIPMIEATGLSTSLIGTGMIITARIAVPALVFGMVGFFLEPYMREIGWIGPKDEFRKVGFLIALGTILGAAIVDLTLIGIAAVTRARERKDVKVQEAEDWKRTNIWRLLAWIGFWAIAVFVIATQIIGLPWVFVAVSLALVFLFLFINGISQGISDSNPISAAFVMSIFILASIGLKDQGIGIMCGAILLIATSVGVDMQQDRSTGWRLGTNRVIQFRFQVIGITMGAVLSVGFAYLFMQAFPELRVDQYSHPELKQGNWTSAMTFKFVGAINDITHPKPHTMTALYIGIAIGFAFEALRKLIKRAAGYQRFVKSGKLGFATDFLIDAVILPSPYASSFGGFFGWLTSFWMTIGGVIASLMRMAGDLRLRWSAAAVFGVAALCAVGIAFLATDDGKTLFGEALPDALMHRALGEQPWFVGAMLAGLVLLATLITWLSAHGKQRFAGMVIFGVGALCFATIYPAVRMGLKEGAAGPHDLWNLSLLASVAICGLAMAVLGSRAMKQKVVAGDEDLPEDMSTTSLVGGGFIAGDSLAALGIGIASLIASMV